MKHICVLLTFFTVFISCASEPVDIPDPYLADAIREALHLGPNAPIPQKKLEKLVRLSTFDKGITDLTGIEKMTSLTSLSLDSTQIADVTPLAELTNLTSLSLRYNQIEDLTPLSGLTQLRHCTAIGN